MLPESELIASDIDAYLAQHERKELLRFLTCGSVDDGKTTLIGRLLHDTHGDLRGSAGGGAEGQRRDGAARAGSSTSPCSPTA